MRPTLFILLICIAATNSCGQEPGPLWQVGQRQSLEVQFVSIMSDGRIEFASATEPQKSIRISRDSLVCWGHYLDRAESQQILLNDGSLLVANVVAIEHSVLKIESRFWKPQSIPLEQVLAIQFFPRSDVDRRFRLLETLKAAADTDRVWLANGDTLPGTLTALQQVAERGKSRLVTLQLDGNEVSLEFDLLDRVRFADHERKAELAALQVGLIDGSLLQINSIGDAQVGADYELAGGITLHSRNRAAESITYLRSYSDQFAMLSTADLIRDSNLPMFSAKYDLKFNRSVLGGPLMQQNVRFLHGVGMHSTSNAVFKIPPGMTHFVAQLAIDDSAQDAGSVVFKVYLLQNDQWQAAYQSETLRGGQAMESISIELNQSPNIALVVEPADQGDLLDRANWLTARFEKQP
jgi:hypothetical protein